MIDDDETTTEQPGEQPAESPAAPASEPRGPAEGWMACAPAEGPALLNERRDPPAEEG